MNKREYRDLMKNVLEEQIQYIRNDENYEHSYFLQGQEVGLMIAIERLDVSEFLLEDK